MFVRPFIAGNTHASPLESWTLWYGDFGLENFSQYWKGFHLDFFIIYYVPSSGKQFSDQKNKYWLGILFLDGLSFIPFQSYQTDYWVPNI